MSDNDFGHKEWGGNIITDQRSSQVWTTNNCYKYLLQS
jgi:hypothetical protein